MAQPNPRQFNAQDAVGLRDFLAKHPAFLVELRRQRPKIDRRVTNLSAADRQQTALECEAWMAVIDAIEALAEGNTATSLQDLQSPLPPA